MDTAAVTVGIVGGTGDLGTGLARRMSRAGFGVVIGSRQETQAQAAADALQALATESQWGALKVSGASNRDAATAADIVFVTVPFSAHAATLEGIAGAVEGKVVVDVTVPLVPPKVARQVVVTSRRIGDDLVEVVSVHVTSFDEMAGTARIEDSVHVLRLPGGFDGKDGVFRFTEDGNAERGLAVLQITEAGFVIADPAPREFPDAAY